MTLDVVTAVLAGLAILVGCVGIIVPILPGSILIFVATLVWAIVIGGTYGWVAFAIIAVLAGIGMAAGWVLTGSRLKDRAIPNSTVLFGALGAIVGIFVIPVVGLPLGFVAGIYLAELARVSEPKAAWESTWVAIKAIGIGVVIEFACAVLALGVFVTANILYFMNVAPATT